MSKSIPVEKNIKQRTCKKCGKTKLVKNFCKRKQTKKDGSAMYLSNCKTCRAASVKKKQCVCGKIISKTAKYCAACAAANRGPNTNSSKTYNINPKWLVRGKVSNSGSGHTQFTQE